MFRGEIYRLLTGSAARKAVLIAIADGVPLELTELDEIELAEALAALEETGLIDKHGDRWRLAQRRRKGGTDDDIETARWMYERIRIVTPTAREPNWNHWSDEVRLMREIDARPAGDIRLMFAFAMSHEFWCRNILSPVKLRKHWPRLEMERDLRRERAHKPPPWWTNPDLMLAEAKRLNISTYGRTSKQLEQEIRAARERLVTECKHEFGPADTHCKKCRAAL